VNPSISPPAWFRLTGNIRVEAVDRIEGANVHPDRITPYWVLVLIGSGERTFRIFEREYAVHSGEFFLLPPNIRHSGVRCDAHQACYCHFHAEGSQIDPPEKIDPDSILLPLHGQIPIDLHCFDLMDYAIRHRTPPFYSEKFLSAQIQAILYQLSLTMQKSVLWTKQENITAYRILKFIDDNKGRRTLNSDYSQAFGKSYRQLNSIFTRVYGMTIKQMQIELRVDQAKRMLSQGYSISETGRMCGFDDYLYFLKVFKYKTDMTPTEYRAALALPSAPAEAPGKEQR